MAAVINTRSIVSNTVRSTSGAGASSSLFNGMAGSSTICSDENRPTVITKVEGGQPAKVNAAILLSNGDGIITASDDRSVRVWLKRDNGQYWPSVCDFMPSAATALDYDKNTGRLFVGLGEGVVREYALADDFNSLALNLELTAHTALVTAVRFSLQSEMVLSCGRDKRLSWYCSEAFGRQKPVNQAGIRTPSGAFYCEAWCTALELDDSTKYAFVGDYSGSIHVLHIRSSPVAADNSYELVTKLSAHVGSIRCLAWDPQRQLLFSGSSDNLVIMWDIGGRRGQAYEMNAHTAPVNALAYSVGNRRLFSCDDNGAMVCWDMGVSRIETPAWQNNDTCQRCDTPFFWNIKAMWDKKSIGLRQHHCRLCGKAVCASCCAQWTKYPPMGYELPVRICDGCHQDMQAEPDRFDLTPCALSISTKVGICCCVLDELTGRLLTVGKDRVLILWDVKKLVGQ